MGSLDSSFSGVWQEMVALAPRIIMALAVFLIFVWLGRTLGRTLNRVFLARSGAKVYLNFLQQLAMWSLSLIGLILALNVLGLGKIAMSLLAGGGMAAIVFGFAFREIGENFIAGFFLTFSRPFEVGDQIESGGLGGEVKNIELRHVHIRTQDGCDIFIPTSQIFKSPLHNFTRDGLRRLSFVVGIDYASDPEDVRAMLLKAVGEVEGVLEKPPAHVGMSALLAQYIELQVFFWVDTYNKKYALHTIKNRVMDNCCKTLKENGVTISSDIWSNINLASASAVALRMEGDER